MKNKRYFAVVVFIVALSLMLGGCALSGELVGNMIAPWESAQQTPEPARTAAPQVSLQPLPTPDVSSAPVETNAPGNGDIDSLMFFSPDDLSNIENLWPLKTYAPEDVGTFSSIFASYGDDYLYLSYTFDSDKALDDLKSELQACVSGAWTEEATGASVYSGTAEGISTDCSVSGYSDYSTVDFTFSLNGNYNEINDILDAHWPGDAIDMPPEMENSLHSRCVMLDPIMIYISYEWELSGYKDTFQWFRDNMSGMDGFTYSPASGSDDEMIQFKIGDVDVKISVSEVYGVIDITFMSYPANFVL